MINSQDRSGERGNVLFLILIAVALFAALSYAVTQSTRSGGGSTEREQALLGSSAMTQYPTALRTSVIRMILGGTGIETIKFNPPSGFGVLTPAELVFHPQGGGATYQQPQADVLNVGSSQWYFNANFEVPGIGLSDDAGGAGADVIAFLPGVSTAVCTRVNEELGINTAGCANMVGGVPSFDATANGDITDQMDDTYTFSALADQEDVVGDSCTVGFEAQASGCFHDPNLVVDGTTGVNVFYSVLLER